MKFAIFFLINRLLIKNFFKSIAFWNCVFVILKYDVYKWYLINKKFNLFYLRFNSKLLFKLIETKINEKLK